MIDPNEFDPFESDGIFKGFNQIKPLNFETLREMAANNDVAKFKKMQSQMIAAKDPEYDIQEALEWAVNSDAFAVVQEIVEVQGVVPGAAPCGIAIENASDFYVNYLFKHGADAKAENESLVYRAALTNPCYLPVLAKHGAKNYTPILNDFIEDDHTDAAIYMLENGAVPSMETLSRASHCEDTTILKHLLVDKGMVPPNQEWIDQVDDRFQESKQLLNKAFLQQKLNKNLNRKTKTKSQGMKI